ncbi:MAG: protein arginine kinase [Clostridia bacterium]|nr:protein arginine kinase [Clostridia bacterium]
MAWFDNTGKENDVVLSSRVRLARNIKDYPFAPMLDETGAREIIEKTKHALDDYTVIDMTEISPIERQSYVEKHIISPAFAASGTPHVLLLNEDRTNAVMVCEEDHLRIQSIHSGLALKEAFASACEIDDRIDSSVSYAYSDKIGYLTHCPTNLGTGMRASVMMFLPALTQTRMLNNYASQLEKLGLTLRGMYGEGSQASAYIYQISNSITMGITEEETISKLESVVNQLIASERKTREKLSLNDHDRLCDKLMRSSGILRSAYMISSKEFLKLFADLKLGVHLGIIPDVDESILGELLVGAMPATLMLEAECTDIDDTERDKLRASYIKGKLSPV